jgi:hypothetical protein
VANFNAFEDALGAGGAIGGGYLTVKAGEGLLKRKLDRDAKYDGMSTDLDYQNNIREASAIQDPTERTATLTKLRRDYDDRKDYLKYRRETTESGGKIALGALGGAAGYGLGRGIIEKATNNDIDVKSALRNAAVGGLVKQTTEGYFSKANFGISKEDWEKLTPSQKRDFKKGLAIGGVSAGVGVGTYGLLESLHNSREDLDYYKSLALSRAPNNLSSIGREGLTTSGFSRADFANPIHGLLAKTGAAAGALSGYQDADKKYWEGRKEIEYIADPEERANRLRDYDSFNSKLGRAGSMLKSSAIRAGIGAGIGYVGSRTAGHLFGDRPQPQAQPITTNMNKQIRKSASFALPNLNLHPNVNLGAKIGAGLGLASGLGIGESDRERENTDIGGRLGKIVGKTAIGGGLGAAGGYGYNKFKDAKAFNNADAAVKANVAPPTPDKSVQQARMDAQAQKWKAYENRPPQPQEVSQPSRWDKIKNYLNKDVKEVGQDIRQGIRNTTGFEKTIRKSANFQDPATIQRLIQKGSTYIPQDNTGVVSLEATLRGKVQKKKLREPKVPASMGVKEINSMIESGKPTGKYFSKSVRKSAVFQQRGLKSEAEFGIGRRIGDAISAPSLLTQAGRYIADPLGNTFKNAASNARGGVAGGLLNRALSILPNAQGAKAKVAKANSLQGIGDYLHTNEGADRAAIGTGLLAGGGLLALGALASRKPKVLEEEQYKTQ